MFFQISEKKSFENVKANSIFWWAGVINETKTKRIKIASIIYDTFGFGICLIRI
jgi:hypothetical protein